MPETHEPTKAQVYLRWSIQNRKRSECDCPVEGKIVQLLGLGFRIYGLDQRLAALALETTQMPP